MLRLLRVPRSMMPEVVWSSEKLGPVSTTLGLEGVEIAGIAGDQQSALFGQMCTEPGDAKNTYGTGCFLLQHIGGEFRQSEQRLLTTLACSVESPTPAYALEGSVFIGGAVVQWLRDGLGIIAKSSDVEALAQTVPDSGGVFFVPAFTGLGAPHWDPYASGTILGIGRGTTKAHIARAALESIALQTTDLMRATPTRPRRCASCASMAAPRPTTRSCRCRPTCSACRCIVPHVSKRPPWALRFLPVSR